jgi:alpha-ribazole phosphatase
MLRLLLLRHGETDWNASGRYQGQQDISLNAAGRRQAADLARRLADRPLHAIYASELARAWETALAVGEVQGVVVRPEPRLRELSFGAWEGLTYRQIGQQDPEGLARWNADRVNRAPPGGESLGAMAARLRDLIDEIRATYDEGTVALVSHGGTIRIILCLLLGHPLGAYWQFEVDNTAIAEIEFRELGPVLVRWNDAHHLIDGHRQGVF